MLIGSVGILGAATAEAEQAVQRKSADMQRRRSLSLTSLQGPVWVQTVLDTCG